MAAASNESQNPKEMDKLQGACSKATFLQKSWEIKFLVCFQLRGGGVRVLLGLVFNAWVGRWCPVLGCLGSLHCSWMRLVHELNHHPFRILRMTLHSGKGQRRVASPGFPTSFQSVVRWGCNNRWVVLSVSTGACETSNLLIVLEPLRWAAGTQHRGGWLREKAAHSHRWTCISAPGEGTCGRELLCWKPIRGSLSSHASHREETGKEGEMGQLQRDRGEHSLGDEKRP